MQKSAGVGLEIANDLGIFPSWDPLSPALCWGLVYKTPVWRHQTLIHCYHWTGALNPHTHTLLPNDSDWRVMSASKDSSDSEWGGIGRISTGKAIQ